MNLFDIMTNAQNGHGMEALARQFNLSQQQAQAAVEALLPAFSQGLKRNASDPYGFGAFLGAMATGNHARYFENPQNAFTPQGMQEGDGILGHLFGSKDLSRAVAAQAAQATGLSQQILQQMLPAIAAMIMGGLSRQSTAAGPFGQAFPGNAAGGFAGSGNPLQEIIEQMMRQGGMMGGGTGLPGSGQARQEPPREQQPADPFDNPFGKMLKDMFGGSIPGMPGGDAGGRQPQPRPAEDRAQPQNPWGDNPLGRIFEDMLRGTQSGSRGGAADGGGPARGTPPPEPDRQGADKDARQRNPYDDLFGEMFETGRKQRDEYEKTVGSIFDQFTKGMNRYR
jgi:hypothetical protein